MDGFVEFIRERKFWFLGGLGILGVWGVLYLNYLPDGKLRLVFCDVGQGDGVYIDLPDGSDVLIDGGPNQKILDCLGKNMPFWDRKLEIVILTHPQADHLEGLVDAVGRYEVDYFVASPVGNKTKGFEKLTDLIKSKDIRVKNVYAGEVIKAGGIQFRVLWPSREFVTSKVEGSLESFLGDVRRESNEVSRSNKDGSLMENSDERNLVSAKHRPEFSVPLEKTSSDPLSLREVPWNVLGVATTHDDLNDFSIVLELKFGEFEALLGGDADEEIQDDILASAGWRIGQVEVFKVPHHGSKYGILEEYLDKAAPKFAVISVGKNRWGHPTKEIIERIKNRGIELFRTDKHGNVRFTTDGKQVWVGSDRKWKK